MVGLFLLFAFAAIGAARDFLMPVTMAILLFFVFAPFRRWMLRRGMPEWFSALLILVGLVVLLSVVVGALFGPAGALIDSAPTFAARIEEKLGALTGPLHQLQTVAARIDLLMGGDGKSDGPNSSAALLAMAETAPILLTQTLFVLLLLFFMMSSGDLLYLKIVQSFPSLSSKRHAYAALRAIENSLGSYLSSITLINALLGCAIGLTMWLWGMPAPVFFGVLAFVLNFIPYFGVAAGAIGTTLVALVSLDGFAAPLLVGASYIGLCSVEGNLITPTVVSRRLEMNTVVVFLAVALWAWLWSIVGMIVAVPLLVVARVLCEHVPGLERIGNFLGGEDPAPLGFEPSADPIGPQPPPEVTVEAGLEAGADAEVVA